MGQQEPLLCVVLTSPVWMLHPAKWPCQSPLPCATENLDQFQTRLAILNG